ncbi:MAG: LolA family protein [Gammaproteobacteria bacterium]
MNSDEINTLFAHAGRRRRRVWSGAPLTQTAFLALTRGIKQSYLKLVVSFLTVLVADVGYAEDTLSSLMQRMQSSTAVRIAYRETRTLELMERPWQGSGYMYSLPPDLMIKEQVRPERVLMGVKGDQMVYFDPGNAVRHHGEMTEDNPMTLNIAVFKALVNGDEALLHKLYQVEFTSAPLRWTMTLTPKQDSDSGFNIVISGLSGQQADTIEVRQADGDSSEFSLQPDGSGDEVDATVERLYRELLGD